MTGSATVQGEFWSADPQGWAARAESRLQPLYEAVLERLDPRAGARLLDAGCGTGLLVALAAERGAVASGLDAAPGLVEYARGRCPAAEFVVGDLEALPFPDEQFEMVTAVNSVPYAANPRRAIAELARVTAAGGRVVLTVGTGPESATCAAMIDPLIPPDVEASSRMTLHLGDRDETSEVLRAAGLAVVEQSEIEFVSFFADVGEAVRAQLPAGPVEAAARHSGRHAVDDALRAFFGPRARADGSVPLNEAYLFVISERVIESRSGGIDVRAPR